MSAKTPVLKTECNGVDLVEIYRNHPSWKMRALAGLEMTSRASIQEQWMYASRELGMDREEFQACPWSGENTTTKAYWREVQADQRNRTKQGGLLIDKNAEAERRRVFETHNRIRALWNLPPL